MQSTIRSISGRRHTLTQLVSNSSLFRNLPPLLPSREQVAASHTQATSAPWGISTLASQNGGQTRTQSPTHRIEELISSLPLVRHLRTSSSAGPRPPGYSYKEVRPYRSMHPKGRESHLVATSLFAPTKLPIDPFFFIQRRDGCRVIATCYAGPQLCGHPGYVHGGLMFLLFDDIFARCASLVFEGAAGMTANMNIDFRKPALPNRVLIYRAEVTKVEGRKAWFTGQMRCLNDFTLEELMARDASTSDRISTEENESQLVAEATALFVKPKFEKSMVGLFSD